MAELGGADEIAKLADLKERGLLTDKEFEKQRRRLLNGHSERRTSPGILGVVAVVVLAVVLVAVLLPGSSPNKPVTVKLASASTTQIDDAVNWAKSQAAGKNPHYDGLCLAFVTAAWAQGGVALAAEGPNFTAQDYWNEDPNGWTKHPSSGVYNSRPFGGARLLEREQVLLVPTDR